MAKTKRKRKLKPLSQKLIGWWHPTLNGDLRPEGVSAWSGLTVYFLHYDEKWKQWHEWDSTPERMSVTGHCPLCTGRRLVVGMNDLATRNTTVAVMWHPTLNGDLTPQMVTEHSSETRWWQHYHEKTGKWHEWPMPVGELTRKKPRKCSVCRGFRVQVGVNDLATTHSDLALEWHPTLNGELTAQMVTKGSNEEVWWQKDCFRNGVLHEWHAMPNSRTNKNLIGCAICHGTQIQVGVNDLASQYPVLALEWDTIKNKNLTPQMVTESNNKKVFWKHKAKSGSIHRWPARIADRAGINGTGCPESECTKRGFDPMKSAHLYVIVATIQETQVIQFGISNNVQARLTRHHKSGFINPPVRLIPFGKGSKARILEKSLQTLMHDYDVPSCFSRDITFDGSTESFLIEDAIDNEDFLKEFMDSVGE